MEENNYLLTELLQNLQIKHAIRGWLKVPESPLSGPADCKEDYF